MGRLKFVYALLLFAQIALPAPHTCALTISTAPVGNPGNTADTRYREVGVGAVAYSYQIGITEVTNAQYLVFLNSVAKSDPYTLWAGGDGILRSGVEGSYSYALEPSPNGLADYYANKPVRAVSWFAAARFTNWLHNGQGNADTESGAYTFGPWDVARGRPVEWVSIPRNPGARWFLPSEDEWYKAAYFAPASGTYFDYPTGSDVAPNNNLPSEDTGNSGNFYPPRVAKLTDVGAYALSESPYGTFDQGGNVWEWTETAVADTNPPFVARIVRGESAYYSDSQSGHASVFQSFASHSPLSDVGFRVATIIPEPRSSLLAGFAIVMAVCRRSTRTA